jgi:hypothetical protein
VDLKLRRWSGQVSGGLKDSRLVIRDLESNEKLGHVQVDTGWLFMQHEDQREQVRRALDATDVDVAGPPIEALAGLPYLRDVFCALGTRSRIKMQSSIFSDGDPNVGWLGQDRYNLTTGEKLPPVHVGEFHFDHNVLTVSHPDFWEGAVGQLRRLGVLALDQEPAELTNAVVDRLNDWSTKPVKDEHFGSPHPAFYGRPLDPWTPGRLTNQQLEQVRAQATEIHAPKQGRDTGRRLTAYAESLLPGDLVGLVAFSVRQDEQVTTRKESARRQREDPRGYYREWTKPGRWDTPEWQYDGRGKKGLLDERHFTADFDRWLSDHKQDYGGAWATVAAYDAEYDYPDLWREAYEWVRQTVAADEYFGLNLLPGLSKQRPATVEWVASRLWRRQRKKLRDWPALGAMQCPICSSSFEASDLDPSDVFAPLGPPRWCSVCCRSSWGVSNSYGTPDFPLTQQLAICAIQNLSVVQGFAPAPKWHLTRIPRGLSETQRDRLLLARMAMPRQVDLKQIQPPWNWVDWMREAGLVGDTVRTARGTLCTARDGHPCRSLLELAVDDYLDAAGLAHELEPAWPWHARLNPSGRRRADWRLVDGTLIEAAGLMDDASYATKMAEKMELASTLGIRLVVITPEDLPHLPDLIAAEVGHR